MLHSRSRPAALATLAMLAALAAPPAGAEPTPHAPSVDARWAVADDGVRVRYEVEGDGAGVPIVLVAGGPGSSHHGFHLTHRRLAALGRLVYLDNRGRGRSDPGVGPAPYTIERDVADVEAVRRALGAERIVLYGRSYGGMVAQAYALTHPARVQALILSNTLDGARAWQEEYIEGTHAFLARQFPERWERIVRLHEARTPAAADTHANLFGPLAEMYHYDLGNDSTYRAGMLAVSEPGVPIHSPAVYRAMIGPDPEWRIEGTLAGVELLPRLPAVAVPALVLAGRYDRICPPSAARRIARALPDARLVVFERSGHRPELEQADAWYAEIEGFLRGRLDEPAPGGAR
jgi:proline iminopeptidase